MIRGGGDRCGSGSAVSGGSGASSSAATSALGGGEASPNTDDSGFATSSNELDRMEAHETVRMHLDELRRENVEKRAHVRALKLVSNEDSSKFRIKRKVRTVYPIGKLLLYCHLLIPRTHVFSCAQPSPTRTFLLFHLSAAARSLTRGSSMTRRSGT